VTAVGPPAGDLQVALAEGFQKNEPQKSQNPDGFEKSSKFKARKSRGARRTYVRRSDFEMQCNAEIGLFAEPSHKGLL
jgi:hypothetical protein